VTNPDGYAPLAPLVPGMLWPAIVERTAHALRCGALQPIATTPALIESGGVRFVVREVSSLVRKDAQREARVPRSAATARVNPFLPPDPDLFVADLSASHRALLNKFNVIDHHLLIVTRAFESQQALLNLADFEALLVCLAEFDGIGFYNGGEAAGASQPHKHLQIVPLPLGDMAAPVPIEPVFPAALQPGRAARVLALPFQHAVAPLDLGAVISVRSARTAFECYRTLLEATGVHGVDVGGVAHQSAPYNLLVTRRWMLLVPRSVERVDGIAVNALGYAGSLFVRDASQMETVRELGPMTVLQRAALPASA
jgi:ATP adenylyltransferase